MISARPGPSELNVVCAWCDRALSHGTVASAEPTSHGICQECLTIVMSHRSRPPLITRQVRAINDYILEHGREPADDEPIAFFCECRVPSCHRPAWLRADQYREAREDPSWLALADGHRPAP